MMRRLLLLLTRKVGVRRVMLTLQREGSHGRVQLVSWNDSSDPLGAHGFPSAVVLRGLPGCGMTLPADRQSAEDEGRSGREAQIGGVGGAEEETWEARRKWHSRDVRLLQTRQGSQPQSGHSQDKLL
jgi:hypothetical protein